MEENLNRQTSMQFPFDTAAQGTHMYLEQLISLYLVSVKNYRSKAVLY